MKILKFMAASCFLVSLLSVSFAQGADQKVEAQAIVDKAGVGDQ